MDYQKARRPHTQLAALAPRRMHNVATLRHRVKVKETPGHIVGPHLSPNTSNAAAIPVARGTAQPQEVILSAAGLRLEDTQLCLYVLWDAPPCVLPEAVPKHRAVVLKS